ncbi:DUF6415 family natural product biosynthesis protein [Streptomyces sp. NPDC058739]|uniref:DUF6415 family natural product biosynthesis protein n=1 Tax=Streptomyces sp. NPDC058739 TaxID=3346618 RepID=UPI00367976ED
MAQDMRTPAAGADTLPLDVETMRGTARPLLAEDAELPTEKRELEELAALLRDHIVQLMPEVAGLAVRLPRDDVPRACASACIGEANMRLRLGVGDVIPVRQAVVAKLARSVMALCDHYENLSA